MEWNINPNAVNQLAKGTVIFTKRQPVISIAFILKGRVSVNNDGAKFIVGSGAFLGLNDLYAGSYLSTYTALDDLIIYVFPISRIEELETIVSTNKDYHGYMVAYLNKIIHELDQIYQTLMRHRLRLYNFLKDNYEAYTELSGKAGYEAVTAERILSLTLEESDLESINARINFYNECNSLPIDVVKAFYSYGNAITLYQIEDQVDVVNQMISALMELSGEVVFLTGCLADESDQCLFQLVSALAIRVNRAEGNSDPIVEIMDNIIEEINAVEAFYEKMQGRSLQVNRKLMEQAYHVLLTGSQGKGQSPQESDRYPEEEIKRAKEELTNSFQKILEYAEVEPERAVEMAKTMQEFVLLKDKASAEEAARTLRRRLTDYHYELYRTVFLKEYREKNAPRIIECFLRYGYADERLLTKEQLLSLYFMEEDSLAETNSVYNIKEWLTLIYEGKKEPSKNEFDMEYSDMLLSLKKQGKLTERDVREWAVNPLRRLEYEIQNMFRYNNRITSGQISNFVPVLYKEMLQSGFEKSFLTRSKVMAAIEEIQKIDYSVFYRETIFSQQDKNIVKEYVLKKVYPDIILMPTIGINGVMWQEITGKKRDSAGRFLLPVFCEGNLTDILIKIFGRFRWELCRSIEGVAWNDIKQKSLTSEYSDYLQFYRKNKDLSEEKKEKVKLQIQKGRNNSREIFTIDYEQWIRYESTGAIKLNKPVRGIMATYCPFSKEIREKLVNQPMFEEAMARFYRERQKKVREIETRHRLLQKEQVELTQELLDTLDYYRDL